MEFDFDECREVLRQALVASISAHAERIASLEDDPGVDAISFDILPWQPFASLSFRATTDTYYEHDSGRIDIRQSPADWKYYDFINDGPMEKVLDYTSGLYEMSGGQAGKESYHLILLAAAHALLDESVVRLLEGEMWDDDCLCFGGMEYFVQDEDKTFGLNYCELVRANQQTNRLLGRLPT